MTPPKPVNSWSAREAVSTMVQGDITAAEYAQALLDQSLARERLNAFVTLDENHVLDQAEAADAGQITGPLKGLPVAFKDAIGTQQLPTTAATPALREHRPIEDADVVSRLRKSGAYVFGKLNMHELSYGITSNNQATGAVCNPHDPARIAGGSSGGAGAAVAARMVPAAIGTDTGGSIRIPAALCGTVGFRPSTGRYSQAGIIPVSHTRDTAGPLTRSVDDAAMLDAVIAGNMDELELLAPKDIHIGLPNQHYTKNLHDDTRSVFEARLSELRDAGFQIVPVDVAGVLPPGESCGFPIAMWETKTGLTGYLEELGPVGLSLKDLIADIASQDVKSVLGSLLKPEFEEMRVPYQEAIKIKRPALRQMFADCFALNRLDALIFPTTILPASPIGDDETTILNGSRLPTFPTFIHNTDPGSIAGLPGISIPAGLTGTGLPVGIELDGPAGSDRHLLAVAAVVERFLPPAEWP